MKRKDPISTDALIEASWQVWLVVMTIAVCVLLASVLPLVFRPLPPEWVVQNCPPLWPGGSAYGPVCF